MFRPMIIAGILSLGAIALAPAAEARTNFSVYFGVPFYGEQVDPDWQYEDGYGWYDAERYGDFDQLRHRRQHRTGTGVTVYLGVPFYSYQVGPDWRYYEDYGWYDYGRWGDFRHGRIHRIGCWEGSRLVDRAGFDRVRTVECDGSTYTYRALNQRGRRVTVYVNARTGVVSR